jgi:hypothetical protein
MSTQPTGNDGVSSPRPGPRAQGDVEKAEWAFRLEQQRIAAQYYHSSTKANQDYFSTALNLLKDAGAKIDAAYGADNAEETRGQVRKALAEMQQEIRSEQRNLAELQHRFALDAWEETYAARGKYAESLRGAYGDRIFPGAMPGFEVGGDEGLGNWGQFVDPAWQLYLGYLWQLPWPMR